MAFEKALPAEGDYLPHQIWNFKTTLELFLAFIDDIYASLALFYSLLSRRKLVAGGAYRDFLRDIESIKPELLEKMHRYNEIRHDCSMREEEKEEIRDELFEGDRWLPL